MGTINDSSDKLFLNNNVATWWNDTVAQQSVKNILSENNNLLVTVLDSIYLIPSKHDSDVNRRQNCLLAQFTGVRQ